MCWTGAVRRQRCPCLRRKPSRPPSRSVADQQLLEQIIRPHLPAFEHELHAVEVMGVRMSTAHRHAGCEAADMRQRPDVERLDRMPGRVPSGNAHTPYANLAADPGLVPRRQLPPRTDKMAGIAVGDALKVILVFRLRFPERTCGRYLRHHTSRPQPRSVDVGDRVFGDALLLVAGREDRGTVAGPGVVALAVARVVGSCTWKKNSSSAR